MLFLLLSGEFVAAGQVLVYGGAVMVMFLFVIAYLGDRSEDSPWSGGPSWQIVGAVLAGGALLAEVCVVVGLKAGGLLSSTQHVDRSFGSPESIGKLFLTDHLLAFEITSVVLLVAAVGGVVLGSHARQDGAAMHGPDIQWYVVAERAPLRDRRTRRHVAPLAADHPALGRDHAQLGQPAPDRVLAPARP